MRYGISLFLSRHTSQFRTATGPGPTTGRVGRSRNIDQWTILSRIRTLYTSGWNSETFMTLVLYFCQGCGLGLETV